jgi:hypothetical protein
MINSKLMATSPEDMIRMSNVPQKQRCFDARWCLTQKPCLCLVEVDIEYQDSHGDLRCAICKATTPVYQIVIVSSPDIKIKCYDFPRPNGDFLAPHPINKKIVPCNYTYGAQRHHTRMGARLTGFEKGTRNSPMRLKEQDAERKHQISLSSLCNYSAIPRSFSVYKVPHIPHAIRIITLLSFHDTPPWPRKRTTTVPVTLLIPKQMCSCLAKNMPDSFIRSVQCLFVTGKVVKHAFCYDEDVFRKVE